MNSLVKNHSATFIHNAAADAMVGPEILALVDAALTAKGTPITRENRIAVIQNSSRTFQNTVNARLAAEAPDLGEDIAKIIFDLFVGHNGGATAKNARRAFNVFNRFAAGHPNQFTLLSAEEAAAKAAEAEAAVKATLAADSEATEAEEDENEEE